MLVRARRIASNAAFHPGPPSAPGLPYRSQGDENEAFRSIKPTFTADRATDVCPTRCRPPGTDHFRRSAMELSAWYQQGGDSGTPTPNQYRPVFRLKLQCHSRRAVPVQQFDPPVTPSPRSAPPSDRHARRYRRLGQSRCHVGVTKAAGQRRARPNSPLTAAGGALPPANRPGHPVMRQGGPLAWSIDVTGAAPRSVPTVQAASRKMAAWSKRQLNAPAAKVARGAS